MAKSDRYVRIKLSAREQREIVWALKDAAKKAVNSSWIQSIAVKVIGAEVIEAPRANRALTGSTQ